MNHHKKLQELRTLINIQGCKHCGSNHYKLIDGNRSIHPNTGDEYWDYEIKCLDCHKTTQRSYSENG